jgi:hypothetical protein
LEYGERQLSHELSAAIQQPDCQDGWKDRVQEGNEAFKAAHWTEAAAAFKQAFELCKFPRLAVSLGRALEQSGKLADALAAYKAAATLSANVSQNPEEVKKQLEGKCQANENWEKLRLRVAKVALQTPPARATSVDGHLLTDRDWPALYLDPGEHTCRLTLSNGHDALASFNLREGDETTLSAVCPDAKLGEERMAGPKTQTLPVLTAVKPNGSTQTFRRSPWYSVGFAGLAMAGISEVASLAFYFVATGVKSSSQVRDHCDQAGNCTPEAAGQVGKYHVYRTLSAVTFYSGIALSATGLTLMVTSDSRKSATTVGLSLSPVAIGATGEF